MNMESITKKKRHEEEPQYRNQRSARNRRRSELINSGSGNGNEGGLLDGSADALQLHTVTRKDYRVDSVGLAVFKMSWDLSIGGC